MEKQKSAGAIIYYFNKKPFFLLLQNTLKKTYWEFPKGKIEEDESIENTAIREVEEETELKNLKIIPGFKHTLRWFYQFKGNLISKEAIYVLASIDEKDKDKVKINKEHEKFEWMDYERAMKEINIRANKEMLEIANKIVLEYEKEKKLI